MVDQEYRARIERLRKACEADPAKTARFEAGMQRVAAAEKRKATDVSGKPKPKCNLCRDSGVELKTGDLCDCPAGTKTGLAMTGKETQ